MLVHMLLLERINRLPVQLEIDGRTVIYVGGVEVLVDQGDPAVVRVKDGMLKQEAERGHFGDENVAGTIELCLFVRWCW